MYRASERQPRLFRRSLVRSSPPNPATNQESHGVPVLRRCRRVPPRRTLPVPCRRAAAQAPARPGGGARGGINPAIRKEEDKVVDTVLTGELAKPLNAYCRCWRSGTFPLRWSPCEAQQSNR
ncbi:unnamed protein product [Miscanthus lutarioriparius]|uniref:Uncharacterized protein n=1 Tax=Miscanthus lutarioriparius TaxID=422564 RepID=A0A811N8M6_9POAL|nr:unnamed protein product [Miscanthus lutarioriparius]